MTRIDGLPYYVYTVFGAAGVILYVGSSANLQVRIGQHRATKPWWGEVDHVAVEPFPSRASARAAEKEKILATTPKYNISHDMSKKQTARRARPKRCINGKSSSSVTYTVRVQRDGPHFWGIEVDEIPSQGSQARNLDEVEEMARDFIAVCKDVAPQSIQIQTVIEVPGDARQHIDEARKQRTLAMSAQQRAAREHRLAAQALRDQGISLRDAAALLRISPQRVSQLVAGVGSGG